MGQISGPTAFRHAKSLYTELQKLSVIVPEQTLAQYGYPISADGGATVRIFTGYSTKVGVSIGMSQANTSHYMSLLNAMRCTTCLKPGGPSRESVYILHYFPTDEDFQNYRRSVGIVERRVNPSKYEILVNDLASFRAALQDLTLRVTKLESERDARNKI